MVGSFWGEYGGKSTGSRTGRRRGWWSAVVLVAVLGWSCGNQGGSQGARPAESASVLTVRTVTPQRIAFPRQVDLAGTLASIDQARVSSEVAGMIRQVPVNLGEEVATGEILVRLDTQELEIAVRRAESQLRQTEAQLGIDGVERKDPPPDNEIAAVRTAAANRDDAQAQLARATRLRSRNLLSQADLDTAETRVKVTEAAYQAALENVHSLKASLQDRRAAVELAQKKLDDAVIRAPIAGAVSERLVFPGEFIRENTPVVTLVRLSPLKVVTGIQERYAGMIVPGLPVKFRVESFPDTIFEGTVAHVSPSVDSSTRTFAVEVMVDNRDRRLKPGFFATGAISVKQDENVLAVPEEAVSTMAGVSAVFVVEGGQVRQQVVELGARQGSYLEILGGLTGNEVLASTNLNQLATGVQVEVEGAAPAAGTASREAESTKDGAQ